MAYIFLIPKINYCDVGFPSAHLFDDRIRHARGEQVGSTAGTKRMTRIEGRIESNRSNRNFYPGAKPSMRKTRRLSPATRCREQQSEGLGPEIPGVEEPVESFDRARALSIGEANL